MRKTKECSMTRCRTRFLNIGLILGLVVSAGDAADTLPTLSLPVDDPPPATSEADKPEAEASDTADATVEVLDSPEQKGTVSAALAHGIAYLGGLAGKDDEKWVVPPTRKRKAIGQKDVEIKVPAYKTITVDEPVYEWKVVEEYRDVKVGSSAEAVTVRKKVKVRKRGKQTGTRKVERRVVDPNGPVTTRMVKRPVYGPGGPDVWKAYAFGHNAMAAYAMMEAGVPPDDEVVQSIARNLNDIYEEYGLPDMTWDLAWSLALFCRTGESGYKKPIEEIATKLLGGQHKTGKAAGLWGPVCVNADLLAAMMSKKNEYSRFYLAAKERFAQKQKDSLEDAMNQALDALRTFEGMMNRVTMLGLQPHRVYSFVTREDETGIHNPISVAGYPHHIYSQTACDIESTALAMFALRMAAEKKLMPKETWSPKVERGWHLVRPERASDILRRAFVAMTRNQNRDGGGWSEMNATQPVKAFDKMEGIAGVPANLRSFKSLASPTTQTSTAQGYSVFSSLAGIYGTRYLSTAARNVVAGNKAVQKGLTLDLNEVKGGIVPPYDYCFALMNPPDLGKKEYDIDSWPAVSEFLVSKQNNDGSWGKASGRRKPDVFIPSSVRERMVALPARLKNGKWDDDVKQSDAHVLTTLDETRGRAEAVARYSFNPQITSTAYALIYLASPPAAETEPSE